MKIRTIAAAAVVGGLLISAIALTPKKLLATVVATLIRDQDAAGRHPFAASCISANGANPTGCGVTVPAGEEAVIQNVVFLAGTGPSSGVTLSVGAYINGGSYAPVRINGPASATLFGVFTATQPTSFMADPNTEVSCNAGFTAPSDNNYVACTFTGYYVTLP